MADKSLSAKQQQILSYIKENVRVKGYPPAVREICKAVGLRSSGTVHSHLNKLESLGFIKRDPTKPRAIDALDEAPWRSKSLIPVPLVGVVTAGQPILADENIEEVYPLPADLIGNEDHVFMLSVKGESMINAGILDGDYLLIRQQNNANNGDIIVALVDDEEATVKRFFKEQGRIRLQPENDSMEPIYADNVSLAGKVIGLIRTM